jgi:hypothetical protein
LEAGIEHLYAQWLDHHQQNCNAGVHDGIIEDIMSRGDTA